MIENHMVLPSADPDDGEPGYCHAHQMAFTDWCEACEEDRRVERRRQYEHDIGAALTHELRKIGGL